MNDIRKSLRQGHKQAFCFGGPIGSDSAPADCWVRPYAPRLVTLSKGPEALALTPKKAARANDGAIYGEAKNG